VIVTAWRIQAVVSIKLHQHPMTNSTKSVTIAMGGFFAGAFIASVVSTVLLVSGGLAVVLMTHAVRIEPVVRCGKTPQSDPRKVSTRN